MKNQLKSQHVLNFISDYYKISHEDIIGHSRTKEIVKARQMYFYLAYEYTGATMDVIAMTIDRDHSTAVYAVNKIKVQKEIYSTLQVEVDHLTLALHGYNPMIINYINLLQQTKNYTVHLNLLKQNQTIKL